MYLNEVTPGSPPLMPTAIEVEIWEGYLLRNKTGIGNTLCTYSLDGGPLNEGDDGSLTFRFTMFDWEKHIFGLLNRNNIHFNVVKEETMKSDVRQLLKKKIFIAEDDPDILLLLKTTLEDAGYQVRVSTGGQGLIDGNFSWVDLFLLDQKMPDVDGTEVCRYLRSQSGTRNTPVILISALPGCDKEALQAGADDFIQKPFQIHYLLNVISRLMKRRR